MSFRRACLFVCGLATFNLLAAKMTGVTAVCLVSTMSDSETVAPSPASPSSPLPPSPSPEATAAAAEPICFRLPTAVLTRAEMRKHVLAEVVLWLTGPVLSAAQLATDEEEGGAAGQLIQILDALRSKEGADLPEDRAAALGAAAALTAETCQRFLLDSEAKPVDASEDLMMDFIDELTVDGEQTLQDLWDYSPFEALREAPPLTEEDEEEEDEDEADTYQNRMARLLEAPLEFKMPMGALVAIVVVVIAYLFLVAIVSQKRVVVYDRF